MDFFSSNIGNVFAIMAIFLATFTIGLPHIPYAVLSRLFLDKELQTSEDIVVIKRMLGIIAIFSYFMFLLLLGLVIMTLSTPIAKSITDNPAYQILIEIGFGLLAMLVILVIFRCIRRSAIKYAKAHPNAQFTPIDTNNIVTDTKPKSEIELITINIAKMNEPQINAFNNYLNYLQEGEDKKDSLE